MAKCLVGASGGLSAADRGKLIPGNIRSGITFFQGTAKEITGSYIGAGAYAVGATNVNGTAVMLPAGNYLFVGVSASFDVASTCPPVELYVDGVRKAAVSTVKQSYKWAECNYTVKSDVVSVTLSKPSQVQIKIGYGSSHPYCSGVLIPT